MNVKRCQKKEVEVMFADFDPSLLDEADFKEDSVREVIITPLLTRLGYSPSGDNRIIRSKSLTHPFIYAGTRKIPIKLIPDYTVLIADKPLLILDAKSPTESVVSQKNVQQVYSYAIHPEIKCQIFALCNGKELAIYSVDEAKPLIIFPFSKFETEWEKIEKYLSPKYLRTPHLRGFAPDLGCAFSRLGLVKGNKISFIPAALNLFVRVDEDMMTASANTLFADEPHCVSFDFNRKLLPEILAGLPTQLADQFRKALSQFPFQAAAELAIEIDIDTQLGAEIEGSNESFRPFIIERIRAARFNPQPLPEDVKDIPEHVFRLRGAYKLKS